MEVLNQRAALLSNYEVLTWLRDLESEHLLRTKTALRVKKEEEVAVALNDGVQSASTFGTSVHLEASENLRTVEIEAIGYLSADHLNTTSQTEEGIATLVKNLAPYKLTKAEKLQIVNLMPTLPVELYVIVEELEDRFGQQIDEILDKVKASLSPRDERAMHTSLTSTSAKVIVEEWDEDADAVYDEEYFDDTGAGTGIEGDLEMEED